MPKWKNSGVTLAFFIIISKFTTTNNVAFSMAIVISYLQIFGGYMKNNIFWALLLAIPVTVFAEGDPIDLTPHISDAPRPTAGILNYEKKINQLEADAGLGLSVNFSGNIDKNLFLYVNQVPQTDTTGLSFIGKVEYDGTFKKLDESENFKLAFKIGVVKDINNKSIGLLFGGKDVQFENIVFASLLEPQIRLGVNAGIGQNGSSLSCSSTFSPFNFGFTTHSSFVQGPPSSADLDTDNLGYEAGFCVDTNVDIDAVIKTPNDKNEIMLEGSCTYYSRSYKNILFPNTPENKIRYINTGLTVRYRLLGSLGVFTKLEYTGYCFDNNRAIDDNYSINITNKHNALYWKAGLSMRFLK